MKIILLSLLLIFLYPPKGTIQIVWCSASDAARSELLKSLNTPGFVPDKARLEMMFAKWNHDYNLKKPLVVIKTDKGYFKWPSPGAKTSLVYNESAGVLGTRSMAEPTMKDVSCFFSDTLVVVDTLRFYTGLPESTQFVLKTGNAEYPIPFDKEHEELLISSVKGLSPGAYQQVAVVSKSNGVSKELSRCVMYFLDREEQHALQETLRNKGMELSDCDSLLKRSVPFLLGFYGGKGCEKPEGYYYAQEKVLQKLIGCR